MQIKVGNRKIGKNQPVFIVAEISANHGQNFKRAVTLIKKAKECGVDSVKFQIYTPDIMTLDIKSKYFRLNNPYRKEKYLYQVYEKAYTPWHWFKKLKKICDDEGIVFFASAFDRTAVDLLEEIEVPIHKIASLELIDLPLIEYMAKTKKPLILSTGMATVSEIEEAVNTARSAGTKDIILLKCVSSYPANPEEMNLRTIPHMKELFYCPVGLSDHTLGMGVSIAAVSLGAQVIEKHLTLSRDIKTPDSFFSVEPQELKELVENVRIAEKSLGKVHYGVTNEEKRTELFRRSLFVVQDIKAGEIFIEENIRSIRPGYGLPTKYLRDVLGRRAVKDIKRGTPMAWNLVK